MICPKCNFSNEGWATYCKACNTLLKQPVEQKIPENIQKPSGEPRQRSAGVKRLAILLILVGLISILSLPVFFVKMQSYGNMTEESFMRDSDSDYESKNFDSAKLKEYLKSEQGGEIRYKMVEAGNFGKSYWIPLKVSQKIMYCIALILGIGLFSLKDLYRKLTVFLAAVGIPVTIFSNCIAWVRLNRYMSIFTKPEALKFLKESEKYSESTLHSGQQMALNLVNIFSLAYAILGIFAYSCIIYFLTRPEVKEQFRQ